MGDDDVTNARLEDKQLRELYDRMLDARRTGGRIQCTSPERILAVVRRTGSDEDRLTTLDHVMSCGECAREFELVRAIEDVGMESVTSRPAVPAPPRASWRRYTPLALAASLVLAVGVGLLWRDGPSGSDGVTRGTSAVTLLAPPAEVRSNGGIAFAWRPVAGTVRYELEVVDSTGAVAFSTTTSDTTAALPNTTRLAPGAAYRWWVRASDAAGAQRASEMRRLRVRNQ